MSSLASEFVPCASVVHCTDDELVVSLRDGRTITVPLAWFPRLAQADARQRREYELLGEGQGIHWPALDEDISVIGLLEGRPSREFRAHHS